MLNTKTNNNEYELIERNNISNPNLLDNPDFRINLIGNSYVCSDKLVVNRWILKNSNNDKTISIKINDGLGITFSSSVSEPKYHMVYQKLEDIVTGTYTLSMKITKITGYFNMGYFDEGSNEIDTGTISTIGEHSITLNDTISGVWIGSTSICNVDIEWVKLEKGSIATPFITPDYNEQYRKCLWFFRPICNGTRPAYFTDSNFYILVPEIAEMRTSYPTIFYHNLAMYVYGSGTQITITDSDVKAVAIDNYKELRVSLNDTSKLQSLKNHILIIAFINNASSTSGFLLDSEIY